MYADRAAPDFEDMGVTRGSEGTMYFWWTRMLCSWWLNDPSRSFCRLLSLQEWLWDFLRVRRRSLALRMGVGVGVGGV